MKTISFFSYKGGAGRSTLAYNVIPILAAEHFEPTAERPMIIIDTDVDSCGMSYLLDKDDAVTETNCIQHLLGGGVDTRKYNSVADHPFLSQLIPVGNAFDYPDNNAILLLPAMDNKIINADAKNNYSDASVPFMETFESFLRICEEHFDIPAVIIDSSVGNTATANVSNEAADIIVCCMRPTIQFVNGTRRFMQGMDNDEKMYSSGKTVILVPNVIPQNEVYINDALYPQTAIDKIRIDFTSSFENSMSFTYNFDMLDPREFGIPAVNRFMWCEDRLYNKPNLDEIERVALSRYRKLARIIDEIDPDGF